jgi:hydrogenase maturation protein HypF
MAASGHVIRVRGTVQGVGFRPFVWRLARDMGFAGDVLNDGAGVIIRLWGGDATAFVARLRREAPILSRIEEIDVATLDASPPSADFVILASRATAPETAIAPDAATCPDCLREVLDPADRRHAYAFANCTNCGPRLSIVRAVPYDRANTSMASFVLCADCAREYADPADRRFHAQPVACPKCGPRVWLENADGTAGKGDAIALTARLIGSGSIVAIKGIGGFHLACDAGNAQAVAALRSRKRRDSKPFALMAGDVAMVETCAQVSGAERALLESPAAPIVLLRRKASAPLADGVAPGQESLGFMLAYSPLHHLLMRRLSRPLVLTSGNLTDEPQAIANDDARSRLGAIADAFCLHDRDIVNRVDDSVLRLAAQGPIVLRRARGLAPQPVRLHEAFGAAPPVFATGADLKATIAFTRGANAIVSQHIGDLSTPLARDDYARCIDLYLGLHQARPRCVASDLHPDFHATVVAAALAQRFGCEHISVQHHHAHLTSCMAENAVAPDAPAHLGIILDGTGLGTDGTIWGGEFLVGGYGGFRRAAHFLPIALPGGDLAARQPWRSATAHLVAALGLEEVRKAVADLPALSPLAAKPVASLAALMPSERAAPRCSSAGRLFDAVAALLGVAFERQDYEGEAAIRLEGLASRAAARGADYEIESRDGVLSWRGLFTGILADLRNGREPAAIARCFHDSLSAALVREARRIAEAEGIGSVVLSGGCFNNVLLLESVCEGLEAAGLHVLHHRDMPPGDGGISLGQAAVAARLRLVSN